MFRYPINTKTNKVNHRVRGRVELFSKKRLALDVACIEFLGNYKCALAIPQRVEYGRGTADTEWVATKHQ